MIQSTLLYENAEGDNSDINKVDMDIYEITISVVCADDLKELVSFLVPNYWLPSTTYPSVLIQKDHLDGKAAQLQDNLIVLTTDVQTSRATQSFATTTAYFINKKWNLTSCVLETTDFPDHHIGIFVSEKIPAQLQYWHEACFSICSKWSIQCCFSW